MRVTRLMLILMSLVPAVFSCGHPFTSVAVSLMLPPLPDRWETAWGPASFSVSYVSPVGGETLASRIAPESAAVIEVPRVTPIAIVATPVWPAHREVRLAGAAAIWPVADGPRGTRRSPLPLRYEDAPAAEVVVRLLAAQVDLRRFNVERLVREIHERLPGDPWRLDVERVVEAIAARGMRASYVRAVEAHETGLVAPPGRWHAPSPFAPPVPGGTAWPPLPAGLAVFLSDDGGRATVVVDDEGRGWQSTE